MKKCISIIVLGFGLLTAHAQIDQLAGPRIGLTFLTHGTSADFINHRESFYDVAKDEEVFTEDQQIAFISQYGWQWETRFADGGEVTGIVEWVALVGGMEKGFFLPSASSLVGLRSEHGYEFAAGPNISISGIGMVITAGYNLTFGNLNVPVNLAFVPGKSGAWWDNNDYTGARISLMIGFNINKEN